MTSTTAPAFTHSQTCTDSYIGRSLRIERDALLLDPSLDVYATADFIAYVMEQARFLQHETCVDCGNRALRNANEALRLARKQRDAYFADDRLFVADPAYVNALEFRVLELKGRRDALKAALA